MFWMIILITLSLFLIFGKWYLTLGKESQTLRFEANPFEEGGDDGIPLSHGKAHSRRAIVIYAS